MVQDTIESFLNISLLFQTVTLFSLLINPSIASSLESKSGYLSTLAFGLSSSLETAKVTLPLAHIAAAVTASSSATNPSSASSVSKPWNLVLVTCLTLSVLAIASQQLIYRSVDTKKSENKKNKKSRVLSTMTGLGERFSSALSRSGSAFGFNNFGSHTNLSSSDPVYKENYQTAMKLGGFVGGLVNDGNTCFMNSVLQSLASSNELIEFLNSFTQVDELGKAEKKSARSRLIKHLKENNLSESNGKDSTLPIASFSNALNELLSKLNNRHGGRSPTYKTRTLLKAMKDGPNKHSFLGYNQEDAQEFYQSVMKQVEMEHVKLGNPSSTESVSDSSEKQKEVRVQDTFEDPKPYMMFGLDRLGEIGNIYIPANQIDPSYPDAESKVYPLKLITPVDGLQCERIGCTRCGEIGGIRYSVISGLGLNLPSLTKSSYQLSELLDDWIQEEIIDGVECNRCGLVEIKHTLEETVKKYKELEDEDGKISKLIALTSARISEIEIELSKPIINDEIYKRLHTKNKVQKSQKRKQSFFARPPPLLCIHINRSVFDPRTYMVRKNNAKILFPMKLSLTDYVAEPSDINIDARLPFRKQDEREVETEIGTTEEEVSAEEGVSENGGDNILLPNEYSTSLPSSERPPHEDKGEEEQEGQEEREELELEEQEEKQELFKQAIKSSIKNEGLNYSLKSVISHFGTHNYGHYIAYRKYRKVWWRISDETVRVSSEEEVLSSQGTFMLFYELSYRNDPKDCYDIEIAIPDDSEGGDSTSDSDDCNKEEDNEDSGVEKNGDEAETAEDTSEEDNRQRELISVREKL